MFSSADMDALESKMMKRKKLKKNLRSLKKLLKIRYRNMKWNPKKPESICRSLEKGEGTSVKASFVIEEIFKKIEDTQVGMIGSGISSNQNTRLAHYLLLFYHT